MSDDPSRDVVRQERDLYQRLLELHVEDRVAELLRQALDLIVATTGAVRGYLDLRSAESAGAPDWSIASGLSEQEVESVRTLISSGIIAAAIATGEVIETRSALLDTRFRDNESVRDNRIGAVLCAPIGGPRPVGVLYLQGAPGDDGFSDRDRHLVEIFARHFGRAACRAVEQIAQARHDDPTAQYRARLDLTGIVGHSASLARVFAGVGLAAPLDVSVLLTGPTGTGKTQLARAIHNNGPRASGPFVELNCAAIPESLVESELFGFVAGAHATANRRQEGRLAIADGGTVFLDEVGELPLTTQVKLLQFLDSRMFWPLGASAPRKADVRLIAATNVDLDKACADGRFREDLLYRLRVLPIATPSLAERRDDLATLAEHFIAEASQRHRLPPFDLTPSAVLALEQSVWPGNVRQLRNCVETAAIRAAGEGVGAIERRHLFPDAAEVEVERPFTWQESTRQFQKRLLVEALDDASWNVSEAARRLDLTRAHVYNLIAAFGLERNSTHPS